MSANMLNLLWVASLETIYMVFISGIVAALLGIPLGVLLMSTRPGGILENRFLQAFLAALVNIFRSIPFIILMIFLIPFTRALVGTSIGTTAAIVPLAIGAIPFVARVCENALLELPAGLIETGLSMGASSWQIITKILLPEALPGLINGITLTLITLVGYSAMAGAIGGGGLGNLAINYGYQRFELSIMISTIVLLIFMVQVLQFLGDYVVKRLSH